MGNIQSDIFEDISFYLIWNKDMLKLLIRDF